MLAVGATNAAGSRHDFLVVPTVHPAFALRDKENWLAVIEKDLERAIRLARDGWDYRPEVVVAYPHGDQTFTVTLQRLSAFFQSLRLDAGGAPIAVDTETTGIDQHKCGLRSIAFSQVGTLRACSIPYSVTVWGSQVFEWVKSWIATILRAPVSKVAHNWGFDRIVLEKHGFRLGGTLCDTVLAHHTIESDLPHELGFVAQRYLDVDPWKRSFEEEQKKANRKGDKKWQAADWVPLLYYNARDALEDGRLWPILLNAVHQHSPAAPSILALQHWEADLAVRMSYAGVPIDEAVRQKTSVSLHAQKDAAVTLIRTTMNWPDFSPRKPKHREELLYGRLKLPVRKYTAKKSLPSTSYRAIVEHAGLPQVKALIEFDEVASLLSNVVDKYAALEDGRLHITWNPTGTDGSRMSSSPNLQNWPTFPVNVRTMACAPPGRILVGADYDQLEYRILAAFAGARTLLELFRSGKDPHNHMAEMVFGDMFRNAPPKVRKALRTLVKRVVYGMNYGAGAKKVFDVLVEDKRLDLDVRSLLTLKQVAKIMEAFFAANPEVVSWREETLETVNTCGYLTIPPLGRTRNFLALPVDGPKAWNWPIQVCGHDFLMLAMHKIDYHKPAGSMIILDGHDAVTVECNEADGENVKALIEWAMTADLDGPAGPVKLTCSAGIGRSWAET